METIMLLVMLISILVMQQAFISCEHIITIQIAGKGNKNIYSSNYNGQTPDEIYINEIKKDKRDNNYNFTEEKNNVTLIWSNSLENCCSRLFQYCWQIKEIDLSRFNNSGNENMDYMFSYCSGLASLDLTNVITSQVKNMEHMFEGCNSLKTLDLTYFDTSEVINMEYMFSGCSQLSSINFGNSNTGKVTNMKNMFSGCSSLTNFDINY